MAKSKKTLRLSDVINQFRDTVTKTAGDGIEGIDPNAQAQAEAEAQAQAQAQAQAEAEAQAQAQAEAEAQAQAEAAGAEGEEGSAGEDGGDDPEKQLLTDAAKNVVQADAQLSTSVDALKSIAKHAQEMEKEAFAKEASEFGKIFANGFLEEVENQEVVKLAMQNAYEYTMNKLAKDQEPEITEEDLTKIAEEAYQITMEKLAGADDLDEDDFDLDEDTYGAIVKEAYDITVGTLEKEASDVDPQEIAQQAYVHTLEVLKSK